MRLRKPLIWLALLFLTNPVTMFAQSTEGKTLTGVWEVKIEAGGVAPPPLLSLAIFGGDGSFTTTGNGKIDVAGVADGRGPGYGRWAQAGNEEFKLTFYAVLLKEGEVNGYMRVRSTMTLSESGNDFTSKGCHVEFLDKNWDVRDSDDDRVTGKRLDTP
jgi:hypothetical protein